MTRSTCDLSATQRAAAAQANVPPATALDAALEFDSGAVRAWWLRTLAMVLAFVLAALFVANVQGQAPQYQVIKYERAEAMDAVISDVKRLAQGYPRLKDNSKLTPKQRVQIQEFYQLYIPAKLTEQKSAADVNELMEMVNGAIIKSIRSRSPNYRSLMGWIYGGMKKVATGNYHPGARVNAIQFISHIDSPAQGSVPQPNKIVIKDLLPLYADKTAPDGVRAAALHGLDRFVRYTPPQRADAETKQLYGSLTKLMTELLDEEPPAGRDELAHAFLQRYAVNILTNLASDGSLGKSFVSVSIDEKHPNLLALHSAAAVGQLPEKMKEGEVEHKVVLKQWTTRIALAYRDEIARLEALAPNANTASKVAQPTPPEAYLAKSKPDAAIAKPQMGMGMGMGMGMEDDMYGSEMEMGMDMQEMGMQEMGMMGMGMMGMGMVGTAAPQPPEIVASRRQLNYAIQQVLLGVTGETGTYEDVTELKIQSGLIAATPADSVAHVQDWLTTIYSVTSSLNDAMLDKQPAYIKALNEQLELLEELIASDGAAAVEAPNMIPGGFNF